MSADLLSAAKAEEQRLLRELQATALFRRLEAVRALLAEYEATPVKPAPEPRQRHQTTRETSVTAQVIAIAQEHLRQIQRRAQSVEILQLAQERGVDVRGNRPATVVASILSHCDLFDNVRGQGYGLKEWATGRADSDVPSDESGELLGVDQTESRGHDKPVDSDAQLGVNTNGATALDQPWPRIGS